MEEEQCVLDRIGDRGGGQRYCRDFSSLHLSELGLQGLDHLSKHLGKLWRKSTSYLVWKALHTGKEQD